jgi:DNA-binding transcriptional ArsR family regulator
MRRDVETQELVTRLASRFRALGDPTRLLLLVALETGEQCVGDLVSRVGGSQANVSKHLGVLRGVGLVTSRREGTNVYYSVDDAAALEVCRLMCGSLERQVNRDLACLEQAAAFAASPPENAAGATARGSDPVARDEHPFIDRPRREEKRP